MPEKKKIGRDFPLAPTSAPQSVDNTRVAKPYIVEKPKYTYKESNYNKLDSLLYKEGFKEGMQDKTRTKESLGKKSVVGISDRFNEGYSEGKDIAIKRRYKP